MKLGKNSPYEQNCKKVANYYRTIYRSNWITKTEKAAKIIYKAGTKRTPRTRYLFGFGAKPLVIFHHLLPNKVFDSIMKRMYK